MLDPWLNVLQTFGLAVTVLAAAGVALWRGANWTAQHIVIPLRDQLLARTVDFFGRLDATLDRVETNVDAMTVTLQRHTNAIEQSARTQAETLELVRGHITEAREAMAVVHKMGGRRDA